MYTETSILPDINQRQSHSYMHASNRSQRYSYQNMNRSSIQMQFMNNSDGMTTIGQRSSLN